MLFLPRLLRLSLLILFVTNKSVEIDFEKGHTTEISVILGDVERLVSPGEVRNVPLSIKNSSNTDSAYVFVEVEKNDSAWSIDVPQGWVAVGDNIYAYGDSSMTPVECGETIAFNAVMTVVASGASYQSLVKDDFKVVVTAKAINNAASRESVGEAYADYENGGNQDIVEGL